MGHIIISVSEDEVRGTEVRKSAGGADDVDVAESEEPRKLWAIISVSEDHPRKAELPKAAAMERSKS